MAPEQKAKIVSLVPSWTETLLVANLDVVERTRFCIHPAAKVRGIPVGTGCEILSFCRRVSERYKK